MITVLIFILILGVLIFVHELGHFLAAKRAGVRVEEFGFGYPPRALTIGKKWGTVFTLNWIPFGGFVKIVGEDYEEDENSPKNVSSEKSSDPLADTQSNSPSESFSTGKNFIEVSKKWQVAILAAGVTFNFIFAWMLFSLGFLIGLPAPIDNSYGVMPQNPELTIISVFPSSVSEEAGLKPGDKIKSVSVLGGEFLQDLRPENIGDFINTSSQKIIFEIDRGGEDLDFELAPQLNEEGRRVVGIATDMIGTLTLPIHKAIYEGGKTSAQFFYMTAVSIGELIKDAFVGKADVSQIAGPVGIVGLVGDASRLGIAYLLSFTALISINLAVINLFPFPALDGGRIVMVAIEGMTGKKISHKIAGTLNTVGFVILILLMLFITYRDILKLF